MLLGGYLTLWIGPTVPFPAPPTLLDYLEQVSVTHNETGPSGFSISFGVGRNRALGVLDYPPLLTQMIRVGYRVQIYVTVMAMPRMLMDGIITSIQVSPSSEPNGSKLTIIGEDVSVMMALTERKMPYTGLADYDIVNLILLRYAAYSVVPMAFPPLADKRLLPTDGTPQRNGTDRDILNDLARRYDYVFYIDPLLVPGVNTAYWGPPVRSGLPQRALTFGMGPASTVNSIQLSSDGTKPKFVQGEVQPTRPSAAAPPLPPIPVLGVPIAVTPLAAMPAFVGNAPFFGTQLPADDGQGDVVRALLKAQSQAERTTRDALTASGELDVARYGDVLRPRALVDVRGVGLTFDGTWYVKSVTHSITRSSYKESFNLERDGTFPLSPVVRP